MNDKHANRNFKKQRTSSGVEYTVGSGNIFADLELPNAEEELLKSNLAIEIGRIIKSKGWTQKKAAEEIGISQPRISMMLRDQLDDLSVDVLLRAVRRLGRNIEVRISAEERPPAQTTARVLVA